MALIALAADKGAPGVTTASLALAAVWPRPVLLAEADPAGGDLVYRLPAADGGRLDPRRGLLSLAVAARRGIQPAQVWEHTQKLNGGLDILTGVGNVEQAGGLQLLWGKIGQVLAGIGDLDVVADCGRLDTDGPFHDLLGHASAVVLVARPNLEGVVRLRHRAAQVASALAKRGQPGTVLDVVVVADYKQLRSATAEVASALQQGNVPARVAGGLAYEPRSAEMLRGEWGGKLDKSMLIRTAREIAGRLVAQLPVLTGAAGPAEPQRTGPPGPPGPPPAPPRQDPRPPRPESAEAPAPPQDVRPARPEQTAPPGHRPADQPLPQRQQQPRTRSQAAPPTGPEPRAAQQPGDRLVAGPQPPHSQLVSGSRTPHDPPDAGPGQAPSGPGEGQ